MRRTLLISLLLAVGAASLVAQTNRVDNPSRVHQLWTLKKVNLKANGHVIHAWVMDDDSKREEGMMFLTNKEVKDDEGMIFVFPQPDKQSFWMHNTILPLDIVYIDPRHSVLNIQKGKPFNDSPLPSAGIAQYVLELKQGMAAKFGIRKGTKIAFPALSAR